MEADNVIDTAKIQADLENLEDPNPKTWYNEAIFIATLSMIVVLEMTLLFQCIGTSPVSFDMDLFLQGQKIVIFPVVLSAMRASHNKTMTKLKALVGKKEADIVKTKDNEIQGLRDEIMEATKKIATLDKDNYLLKAELDAKSQLYVALTDANAVAGKVVTLPTKTPT